jgi:hypothetical protein
LLGTGTSFPWIGMFRATEFSGVLKGGASGAIGMFTSGRLPVVMTGSGGGAGAVAGVGAGVGGGINTAATSLCPTARGAIVIDVTLLATAGLSTAASTGLAISVGEVSAGAGANADAGAAGCAGVSGMRKSLAPRRLSFQGKFRRGSPNVWPPAVMLNSSV